MKRNTLLTVITTMIMLMSCSHQVKENKTEPEEFNYILEQFADLRVLRYQVPDFDQLNLSQKKLIYFLSQAALSGRDIIWDQNGKYNLAIRKTLENIYQTYKGDRESDAFKKFTVYLKRVWFSNGIYHHYAADKLMPGFSIEYFDELVRNSSQDGFPDFEGKTKEETMNILIPVIFDPNILQKKVSLDAGKDLVKNSAVNFYDGVTEKEVEQYYNSMKKKDDQEPISYGLNSRVVKKDGKIEQEKWVADGLYGPAIKKIIYWLQKAEGVAETKVQKEEIQKLISYYRTGDLKTWDDYNILWVQDTSLVDFVNGFVEVYSDPLGLKGTWESVVDFKDIAATRRTRIIADNAQWFEDHSPIDPRFKKQKVKGVSAKVITVAMLGGDCYPATPIGINLPNSDWIRKEHGSKSVTLENITNAYDQANQKSGALEEFSYDSTELALVKKYGALANNLHTDLHECLGHGSGQLLPGVSAESLKNYSSTLEEARADLFALYYMMDPKMVELGLLPSLDAAKAQYISYIRNGLMTQLKRIQPGKNIEEAHMRNRQLIAAWCYEKGKPDNVIEKIEKGGKTYFHINDFEKLRTLFGQLLAEVQRIKSEGDYKAGKKLVETYGVKVDQDLLKEVHERYDKLDLAPYSGFVNPVYRVVVNNGDTTDIRVSYVDNYAAQMLEYSRDYSYLPLQN